MRTVSSSSAVSRLRRAVGNVPFAIGLLWNSSNDLDLYVNQPDATDVYFGRTSDSDSGATFGGDVRGGSNSMEYIKWTRPDTGRYDVFVRARGSVPSSGIPVEVVVLDDGESTVYKAVLQNHGSSATDYKIVFYTRSDGDNELVSVIEEDEDEIEYIEDVPAPAASTPDSVASAPRPARQSTATSSGDSSLPVTNAGGSRTNYNYGEVIDNYVEANTSTARDSQAERRAASVGRNAPLKITLLWDFSGDIDLIVNQANGKDIYYGNTSESSYGAHYSGDQRGGSGSYESIRWTRPGTGTYDVFVRARDIPSGGGLVKVVVKNGSDTTVYTTKIRKTGSDFKDVRICQFSY